MLRCHHFMGSGAATVAAAFLGTATAPISLPYADTPLFALTALPASLGRLLLQRASHSTPWDTRARRAKKLLKMQRMRVQLPLPFQA